MHTKFQKENLKGRDHLIELGVDGRVILKRILNKWDVRVWIGPALAAGACKYGQV
jgi:hypothetical protein